MHRCCWWVLFIVEMNLSLFFSCFCLSFVASYLPELKRINGSICKKQIPQKHNLCSRKSVPVYLCLVLFFSYHSLCQTGCKYSGIFVLCCKVQSIFMKIDAFRRTYKYNGVSGLALSKPKNLREDEKNNPRCNF